MRCEKELVGKMFYCVDDRHQQEDGPYLVLDINPSRNAAFVQRPSDFKGHWVNARNLYQLEVRNTNE